MNKSQEIYANKLQNYFVLDISDNDNPEMLINQIRKTDGVVSVEPNYIYRIEQAKEFIPDDPKYPDQWALKTIFANKAWVKATGKNIIIGVVDTGIDWEHPDLKNQFWINTAEDINGNGKFDPWLSTEVREGVSGDLDGIDNDGNGFVDDVIGYDFVDQTVGNIGDYFSQDPLPQDEHGHGTNVSGVIAAQGNNHEGMIGLAYNSKIMVLRAFDATGNAESDDISRAIVYAALNGAKVLNFSFGEVYASNLMHEAIRFAASMGCVMPASSGNNNWDLNHYPSDYEECISVGSVNKDSKRSSFSNYGTRIGLTAPGNDIMTTIPYGGYSKKSGTSFSAPFVSAASALLFELDSTLKSKEVAGILKSTTTEAGDDGWDIFFGAGILNVERAVDNIEKSTIEITYPRNDVIVNRSKTASINITGSVIAPLLKNFELYIGEGLVPETWQSISNPQDIQMINDTLAVLNISNLKDTSYVIRILARMKNNRTIEQRNAINIISDNTKLNFISLKAIPAYFNNSRIVLLTAETNYPSFFNVRFRPKNSTGSYSELSETEKYSKYHYLLIQSEAAAGTEMEAMAQAYAGKDIKCDSAISFIRSTDMFPETGFRQRSFNLPNAWLCNSVADFYNDNKSCVSINDISNGGWGGIKVYKFEDGSFKAKDSLNNTWLPRAFGDSNGDRIPEILASSYQSSALFQPRTSGESPFSRILFSDTITGNLVGSAFFDIDKDSKQELIAFSDTSFIAFKEANGRYSSIGVATLPQPYKYIGTFPGCAIGDFDNDGKVEICFGNRNGNVFIFEYSNSRFNLEFIDSTNISNSEQYISSVDLDGNGKPSVLIGNFGTNETFNKNEAGEPVWTYRLLKATSPNQYDFVWKEHFYGVRGGLDYQNGVSAGNLDSKPGDEIVIIAFPNTFVMKWNSIKSTFEPLWFYPYTYSNTALIHDFDGNGIKELGISTFNKTRFFEYNNSLRPSPPLGLEGWSDSDTSVVFKWQTSSDATYYQLLKIINDFSAEIVGTTTDNNYKLSGLKKNTQNSFAVRAVNPQMPDSLSDLSSVVYVYTHSPIEPVQVKQSTMNSLEITFNGRLPETQIEPSAFEFLNSTKESMFSAVSCVQLNDNSVLISNSVPLDTGNYWLRIHSIRDYYNSPTLEKDIDFNIVSQVNPLELFLKKIEVLSNKELLLDYSEPVEKSSAENLSNYSLRPYGIISRIELNPTNNTSVNIFLDNNQPLSSRGKNYFLNVKNTTALSGNKMTTGAGSSIGFVLFENDGESAYIYPNPIRKNVKENIYFAGLPAKCEVIIMNLSGDLIRILKEDDGNGGVEWDGLDKKANSLETGVYIFKVKMYESDGSIKESEMKKFLVLP
ncbi:MAG: S8 family serine peptidase [Bacteroidota bacterium]